MSDISIKCPHHTTPAEAKKVANKVAAKLEKDYQLKSAWDGDVLTFTRSGVNGTLVVGSTDFKIDIKLGFLMMAFKGPIKTGIEDSLTKLLPSAKASAAGTTKAKK